MARVIVGLSGGVDSSVAAYLLKEAGHEVIGLFMKNWHDDSVTISAECPWEEDSHDALMVAQKLHIPFQTLDLSEDYKERIVNYMFREYEHGRTPNPDVLCNREIKYDTFLQHALKLGADFVATGHYCRSRKDLVNGKTYYRLLSGKDKDKDQSYFLCQLNQDQLSKALFPIGDLKKSEVREIARREGLITAEKKDSQGLCFVGKVKLPVFLKQKLASKEGLVIEIPSDFPDYIRKGHSRDTLEQLSRAYTYGPQDGKVIGRHEGAHFYTIGQRKGLGIGGYSNPLFVLDTDTEKNIIFVGEGEDHPGLYRPGLFIPSGDVHWVSPDRALGPGENRAFLARIRYRQPLVKAVLYCAEEGIYMIFEELQRGIAPGQFAAWYLDDELVGSGVIS